MWQKHWQHLQHSKRLHVTICGCLTCIQLTAAHPLAMTAYYDHYCAWNLAAAVNDDASALLGHNPPLAPIPYAINHATIPAYTGTAADVQCGT